MPSNALDETLNAIAADGRVPGIVALVGNADSTLYCSAFGTMGASRPMPTNAVFRIASMTKLVTGVAVMMLVDEDGLELDAPLARYVPGFRQPEVLVAFDDATGRYSTRPAARDATIRELLSHTAGYGYWFLDPPLLRASGTPPDLANPPFLMRDPGELFAYSSSTDVAAMVVEALTGMRLDAFVAERICTRLGMRDTGWTLPSDRGRLVSVHIRRNTGYTERPNEKVGPPVTGGGGLYSTGDDYLRLLRCLLRGGELDGERLLSADSAAEIARNQIGDGNARMQSTALPERSNDFIFMDGTQKFGFGVMIETRDQPGRRAAGSFGWGGILNTYYWVDPKVGLAAVLCMQVSPFADPDCAEALGEFETAVYRELL